MDGRHDNDAWCFVCFFLLRLVGSSLPSNVHCVFPCPSSCWLVVLEPTGCANLGPEAITNSYRCRKVDTNGRERKNSPGGSCSSGAQSRSGSPGQHSGRSGRLIEALWPAQTQLIVTEGGSIGETGLFVGMQLGGGERLIAVLLVLPANRRESTGPAGALYLCTSIPLYRSRCKLCGWCSLAVH